MATMTYTAKIDDTDISAYIKSAKVSYEQMFTDAGRNMAGVLKATYIATSPKITYEIKPLTGAEMAIFAGLVNKSSFVLKWWDEETSTYKTGSFYRGEFEPKLIRKDPNLYEAFSINIIAYGTI